MSEPTELVYVSRHLGGAQIDALRSRGLRVEGNTHPLSPPTRGEVLAGVRGATAAIIGLTERVDAEFLDAAGSQLRIVANVAVGTDNIDVAEARSRGVEVTNTPGVLTDATADLTMGLILAVARRIVEADRFMRLEVDWAWGPQFFVGAGVSGKTLGLVGCGRIGQAVAHRARAFGMRVIGAGSSRSTSFPEGGIERLELGTLLESSDFVSLHCPLTPSTHHLIGEAELAMMKPTAHLVNTSRGPIVDEAALVEALRTGVVAGAGLDVFEDEPRVHPGLVGQRNVVLTPHIGSADEGTRRAMAEMAVANVLAVLRGEDALNPVRG